VIREALPRGEAVRARHHHLRLAEAAAAGEVAARKLLHLASRAIGGLT
jgi:hypothetical protein